MRSLFVRAVETWPDREAVITQTTRLTFEEAWIRGLRLANLLAAEGLQSGDRVAVLEDNTLEASDAYLGCTAANYVRVPLYARNSREAHAYMIEQTNCRALVVSSNYAADVSGLVDELPELDCVLVRDAGYEDLLASAPADDPKPTVRSDDYYIIRHTAGTTGRSKGVGYTHWKWLAYCRDWFYPFPSVEIGDGNMCMSPISHGSGYFFTPVWIAGGSQILLDKFDPKTCLDVMESERISFMWCVPTVLAALSREPSAKDRDWSALKAFLVAGAPITETTARAGREVFGDVLYSGYGQTEIFPVTSITPQEWFSDVPGSNPLRSAGRPYPYALVKIVDPETHQELPVGEDGEIAAKADGQLLSYWEDPEATAEKIVDGWVMTGDIGRFDENGYLYMLDRAGDMIISGGFNIYPAELENAIASHPAVVEVAVFAVPHEKWGETPCAVCVVEDEDAVTEDEVIELCSKRLGSYKKPGSVVITTDALPKSAVGKVLRRVLREPHWVDHDRRVSGS